MSIPLRVQLIDAFHGEQSGIHSIILPDIFSSGGAKNVYMDKYARVKRILGYSSQGAAVTTDTGGSATRVRALFPYRATAGGGSFTRQVLGYFDDAVDEAELWYSEDEGITYTFIADLGASSVDEIPDFEQFGDELYITNGKTAPRVWDGTTLDLADSEQLPAPTLASAGTGVLYGAKTYKIVPRLADGTRKPASEPSAAISVEGESVTITWTEDTDVDVIGYEIYATTGTGTIFYFVDYVDGDTTLTYTDNVEDFTILENRVIDEHGDPPPQAYLCVSHKQRMWYLRTDDEPQAGFFSDPGKPRSVYAESKMQFQDAKTQGDVITGGVGNFEGMLVVFQERSIWTVSGTGLIVGNDVNWNRTKTNAQTGAVSNRAIAVVPAGSRYIDQTGKVQTTATVALAFLTPLKDLRLFDGDNDIPIGYPMARLLSQLNYAQRRKVHTLTDTSRSEIVWFLPTGSSSEPNVAIAWNYRWGVFYEREWPFASAVEVETASEASVLLAGSASLATGGKTFELWDTNFFDGVAFTAQWMTKTMYGWNDAGQATPSFEKRWRWGDFLFETDQDVSVKVSWLPANAPDNAPATNSVTVEPGTDTLLTSDGDTIITADADTLMSAAASTLRRAHFKDANGKYVHDSGIRLRFSDGLNSAGSWSLEAMTIGYQILPGQKRLRSAALDA